jgi:catechol 2,3-dioxygenase-like lactoylglutathione lyase family enzyme
MALAHITLATRDVRRTSSFFEETLGWPPLARPNNIGRPAAWLAIAPGVELHLIEDPEFEPSRFEREFGRHVAVTVPLGEFLALKERLQAHGATLIDPLRDTPFSRFFFRSPDGYVFEIVEDGHEEPRPMV